MRKDSELFVRGVSDLGVRRKPQVFAPHAVSLWILKPSLLTINELELYNAKPRWRAYSAHSATVWHNSDSPRRLRLRSHRLPVSCHVCTTQHPRGLRPR
jgi:hypothetical protein